MCTPKGFLFSREAILENLLEQKKANKRKLAAWEAQQADEARKQVRPTPRPAPRPPPPPPPYLRMCALGSRDA